MKKIILISVAILAVLISGCLLSGTFSFKVRLTNLEASFVDGYIKQTLNLADEADTWDEHDDEIAQIESIHLDAIVTNNTQSSATLAVYVAADSSLVQSDFAGTALPILTDYVVSAQTTDTLTIPESLKLLHLTGSNWTEVQKLVKTGFFTAYASSSQKDASISIDVLNLYISFTTSH